MKLDRITLVGMVAMTAVSTDLYLSGIPLIVAEFNCLIDAKEWADQDPFMLNGVYESINVKPFKKTLP